MIEVPTIYRYLFTEKNYVFYHLEVDKVSVVRILNDQQDYVTQLFGISPELQDDLKTLNNTIFGAAVLTAFLCFKEARKVKIKKIVSNPMKIHRKQEINVHMIGQRHCNLGLPKSLFW